MLPQKAGLPPVPRLAVPELPAAGAAVFERILLACGPSLRKTRARLFSGSAIWRRRWSAQSSHSSLALQHLVGRRLRTSESCSDSENSSTVLMRKNQSLVSDRPIWPKSSIEYVKIGEKSQVGESVVFVHLWPLEGRALERGAPRPEMVIFRAKTRFADTGRSRRRKYVPIDSTSLWLCSGA